ncbi:hypothetical protein [Methylocystis echinoides]|uniref:hypothetical protein n=1 Tax=Methylocystis echinoides TaxID=29468 RepID=UPI00342B2E2A
MTNRNWRRTSFRRLDGSVEFAPDDWTLLDDDGKPLARIYRYLYGSNAGCWSWFVHIAPDGTPFNGGAGTAPTGKQAREACEARVPVGMRERAARCQAEDY